MTISDAVFAWKTAIQAINPTPQIAPVRVYAFPSDMDIVEYDIDGFFQTLPIVVVAEAIHLPQSYSENDPQSGRRFSRTSVTHSWTMDTWFYLGKGFRDDRSKAAEAEKLMHGWLPALYRVMKSDRRLGGAVTKFGGVDELFTVNRKGHIPWLNQEYWGFVAEIPVTQMVTI